MFLECLVTLTFVGVFVCLQDFPLATPGKVQECDWRRLNKTSCLCCSEHTCTTLSSSPQITDVALSMSAKHFEICSPKLWVHNARTWIKQGKESTQSSDPPQVMRHSLTNGPLTNSCLAFSQNPVQCEMCVQIKLKWTTCVFIQSPSQRKI